MSNQIGKVYHFELRKSVNIFIINFIIVAEIWIIVAGKKLADLNNPNTLVDGSSNNIVDFCK